MAKRATCTAHRPITCHILFNMQPVRTFSDLVSRLSSQGRRLRVAVINATDESTVTALCEAIDKGFARGILVGTQPNEALKACLSPYSEHITYLPAADEDEAARMAVELVRNGEADILMKGLLHTDNLLRAVLDKQHGLLPPGRVLSHITVAELPDFPRLLFITDVAVIPQPTDEQREWQVRYVDALCRNFGISAPRIGLVHFTEKVSPKFPLTLHYRALAEASAQGTWGATIIDGPLDVRTCLDPEALRAKGIRSPLRGYADALVFPDLESGNSFYKTITFFAHATVAGILQGTTAPVVLTSRGDDARSKFLSLATAAISLN